MAEREKNPGQADMGRQDTGQDTGRQSRQGESQTGQGGQAGQETEY